MQIFIARLPSARRCARGWGSREHPGRDPAFERLPQAWKGGPVRSPGQLAVTIQRCWEKTGRWARGPGGAEKGERRVESGRLQGSDSAPANRAGDLPGKRWLVCRASPGDLLWEIALTITDFYCAVSVPEILLRPLRIALTPELRPHGLSRIMQLRLREKDAVWREGQSCGMSEPVVVVALRVRNRPLSLSPCPQHAARTRGVDPGVKHRSPSSAPSWRENGFTSPTGLRSLGRLSGGRICHDHISPPSSKIIYTSASNSKCDYKSSGGCVGGHVVPDAAFHQAPGDV